jgi:phosphate transport system protein
MSHYEQRLEEDLKSIRRQVSRIASLVDEALHNAVHALLTGNRILANATVLGDGAINRAVRETDRACHAFIARHLPSAGHLRVMSATIRANIALERIGDYAVSIARESVQLSSPPAGTLARAVEAMAGDSREMLRHAADAFTSENAEQAKATMAMADQVQRHMDAVIAELTEGGDRPIKDQFALFVVFAMLERVSDQAKNLCEETVFAVTGETKAAKVYNILFLDEGNDGASQIAEAVARKTYPNSGRYASAGRRPAEAIHPAVRSFLEEHGFDLSGATIDAIDLSPAELAEYHVIVSLQGPVEDYIQEIPFHTAFLQWDVGEPVADLSDEEARAQVAEMYRGISVQVRDLMEQLRGEGAD